MKLFHGEWLLIGFTWLITTIVSFVYWSNNDPEIQIPLTPENVIYVSLLFLIFLVAVCRIKWAQHKSVQDKGSQPNKMRMQQVGFLVALFAFLGLASVFYYLIIGLLFAVLVSTFLEYLKPQLAWSLAIVFPLFVGTYDVLFKGMNFYLDIKLLFIVVNCLVLLSASKIASERRAKERTLQLLRELKATQKLLSGAVKRDERVRISRDLHDSLGHKLTALNLQLELAENVPENQVQERVARAKSISGGLLSDIRESVSENRATGDYELIDAIQTLIQGIPLLRVDFEFEDLPFELSYRQAETLFRCTQESITNCMRYEKATECQVKLKARSDAIMLSIQDNAPKSDKPVKPGNGLQGLKERVEAIDGELNFGFNEFGFQVRAILPINLLS